MQNKRETRKEREKDHACCPRYTFFKHGKIKYIIMKKGQEVTLRDKAINSAGRSCAAITPEAELTP